MIKQGTFDEVITQVQDHVSNTKELIKKMQKLVIAKGQDILDFTKANSEGFIEYIEGIHIENLTSLKQYELGATMLHVKVTKEVDFQLHEHAGQSQTIYVMKGKLLDLENNILFGAEESYFVSKAHQHRVRYYEGAETLITYFPSLNTVKE